MENCMTSVKMRAKPKDGLLLIKKNREHWVCNCNANFLCECNAKFLRRESTNVIFFFILKSGEFILEVPCFLLAL